MHTALWEIILQPDNAVNSGGPGFRSQPPPNLPSWRAGPLLLAAIGADLRFTPNEVATFLNVTVELDLAWEDVDVLAARKEGWIADLQLAVLSLRGRSDAHGFITALSRGGTTKSGDMACPEVDLNHQSPLQPQCETSAKWEGILTDERFRPAQA